MVLRRRLKNNNKWDVLYYQDQNVIAYAEYCHQDQHSRPISGLVNVCPELLTRSDVDVDRTRMVRSNSLSVLLVLPQMTS